MLEGATDVTTSSAQSELEAELYFTAAGRAPDVTLAFSGLHEPTSLLGELHAIGWSVPPIPPRPGTAIDWTPDPTTGLEYTVLPWRVQEFRLRPSSWWTPENEAEIGAKTIEALKRHGAKIHGLRGGDDQQAEAAAPPQAEAAAPQQAAGSGESPAPAESEPASTHTYIAVDPTGQLPGGMALSGAESGRKRAVWAWGEAASGLDDASSADVLSRGGHIWTITSGARPAASSEAVTTVEMIAVDTSVDDKKLAKLTALLGDKASMHALQPVGAGNEAALVCAVVPTHSAEMLVSNLRLRYPKGIVRTSIGG